MAKKTSNREAQYYARYYEKIKNLESRQTTNTWYHAYKNLDSVKIPIFSLQNKRPYYINLKIVYKRKNLMNKQYKLTNNVWSWNSRWFYIKWDVVNITNRIRLIYKGSYCSSFSFKCCWEVWLGSTLKHYRAILTIIMAIHFEILIKILTSCRLIGSCKTI